MDKLRTMGAKVLHRFGVSPKLSDIRLNQKEGGRGVRSQHAPDQGAA